MVENFKKTKLKPAKPYLAMPRITSVVLLAKCEPSRSYYFKFQEVVLRVLSVACVTRLGEILPLWQFFRPWLFFLQKSSQGKWQTFWLLSENPPKMIFYVLKALKIGNFGTTFRKF